MLTTRRLGQILLGCSVGMWAGVIGAFFTESWWPTLVLGGATSLIALVSIVIWAGQLTEDDT